MGIEGAKIGGCHQWKEKKFISISPTIMTEPGTPLSLAPESQHGGRVGRGLPWSWSLSGLERSSGVSRGSAYGRLHSHLAHLVP